MAGSGAALRRVGSGRGMRRFAKPLNCVVPGKWTAAMIIRRQEHKRDFTVLASSRAAWSSTSSRLAGGDGTRCDTPYVDAGALGSAAHREGAAGEGRIAG